MKPNMNSTLFVRRGIAFVVAAAAVAGCGGERRIPIGRDVDASAAIATGGAAGPGQDSGTAADGLISGQAGASVNPTGTGGVAGSSTGAGGGETAPGNCTNTTPGVLDCGPKCESCAISLPVSGGTYLRSYDGVGFLDRGNPATVSSFKLDKYEVTVGRFRRFVDAVIDGWRPPSGGGKHTHLNGGKGLADSGGVAGTFEKGWNSLWNNNLSGTKEGWLGALGSTLLGLPVSSRDKEPMYMMNWYHAYAFCIWDGGFLPSEAEWNYAASGGSEQRFLPWSTPPSLDTVDCSYANYNVVPTGTSCSYIGQGYLTPYPDAVGLRTPKGDGKWGQTDLAGNVAEWTADWFVGYANPCVDCAYLSTDTQPVSEKVARGGSADARPPDMYGPGLLSTSARSSVTPNGTDTTQNATGFRCARSP